MAIRMHLYSSSVHHMGDVNEELADLRYHYGDAYLIHRLGNRFVAQRRDTRESMSSETADGLLQLIRDDYARKRVPR